MKRRLSVLIAALALLLAGCSSNDPIGGSSASGSTGSGSTSSLVIGSQQYYSNEIIAEIWAQALEHEGVTVQRQFQIGQREIYLPEIQAGRIDLFPDYSGNLMQYLDPQATATDEAAIEQTISQHLGDGLRLLGAAEATDQDSYNVTRANAETYGLTTIADLTKLPTQPVRLGGNSELATRPYGPDGLLATYGVRATVTPIEDSGGPLTVRALTDGTVDVADIYSASPTIKTNDLVTLTDPDNLILPQQVVPIASSNVTDAQAQIINEVSARLTTDELVALNARSVDEQASAAAIATDWLRAQGLI